MDIQRLETARAALEKVRAIEMSIADVDGLRASGTICCSVNKNVNHGDPTFNSVESLDKLYRQLNNAKDKAILAYQAAVNELQSINDDEMYSILFLRHMKKFSWDKVAKHLGGEYSSDIIKQRYSRFLRGQRKA